MFIIGSRYSFFKIVRVLITEELSMSSFFTLEFKLGIDMMNPRFMNHNLLR